MAFSARAHGRAHNELRPVQIRYDVYGYATASVHFNIGNTIIHCSINMQQGVPPFLKGKKMGWLKAEYAMLPSATHHRTQRESSASERNGRSVEISRLISRCLRTIVDLSLLGENTIIVDCDVLQADGGTRTACITAASIALHKAVERWVERKIIPKSIMLDAIAAVSVGVVNGQYLLDIDFQEDSSVDADFNVVLTHSESLIEIQGTCEKKPISMQDFAQILGLAHDGVKTLFAAQEDQGMMQTPFPQESKSPLFSLKNRLNSSL